MDTLSENDMWYSIKQAGLEDSVPAGVPSGLASPLVVFDNFARKNQGGIAAADIGFEQGGKRWLTTGTILPKIRNQRLVAPGAGAGYTYLDFKQTLRSMSAGVVFTTGISTSNSATLILCDTFVPGAWYAIHVAVSRLSTQIVVYELAVATTIATYTHVPSLLADGITVYKVGLTLIGNDLVIDMPDGTVQKYTNSKFGAVAIRGVAIWENFNQVGGNAEVEFSYISALR